MDCFIKKIWQGKGEETHGQFVRFGKGRFETRALLTLQKTSKVKVKGSFEYVNDFVLLVSELIKEIEIEGIILSKEDISKNLSSNNINGVSETKKGGLFFKNNIDKQKIASEILIEMFPKIYFALLDISGEGINLKIKKVLPKPGKSGEGKVNDKFCQLEADLKYYGKIKEAFFWDIPDCNKTKASHIYEITDLIYPKDEKDPAIIRLKTKRKGKIIRKLEIDKQEQIKETNFEA